MSEISRSEIRKRLGNISQLRDLLFGEQLEEYNEKLQQHQLKLDRLEKSLHRVQLNTQENLKQLEHKLLDKINVVADSLGKSVRYYHLKTEEKQKKIQQELIDLSKYSHENMDYLYDNLNINNNNLKIEITQTKAELERDFILFKQQLLNKLESNCTDLNTSKISRTDLAEALFELCLKLKETETNSNQELKTNSEMLSEDSTYTDLILPETK